MDCIIRKPAAQLLSSESVSLSSYCMLYNQAVLPDSSWHLKATAGSEKVTERAKKWEWECLDVCFEHHKWSQRLQWIMRLKKEQNLPMGHCSEEIKNSKVERPHFFLPLSWISLFLSPFIPYFTHSQGEIHCVLCTDSKNQTWTGKGAPRTLFVLTVGHVWHQITCTKMW